MSNMGSSLPVLTRTAKEVDEGVAIPRCALMASSSLEVLENSSVITFSSDRRQRGFTDRPDTRNLLFATECFVDVTWTIRENHIACKLTTHPLMHHGGSSSSCRLARWCTFLFKYSVLDAKLLTAFILLRAHCIDMRLFRSFILY